jgi:hypothetical protein
VKHVLEGLAVAVPAGWQFVVTSDLKSRQFEFRRDDKIWLLDYGDNIAILNT